MRNCSTKAEQLIDQSDSQFSLNPKLMFKRILPVTVVVILAAVAIFWKDIQNVRLAMEYKRAFLPENVDESFITFYRDYPSTKVEPSAKPLLIPEKEDDRVENYVLKDGRPLQEYLDATQTTAFLVMQGDSLLYENYFRMHSEEENHISFSVAKSFTSSMIGIAVGKGMIGSIQDPVDKYVPSLKGSGYEGVAIKDVLHMSSGIQFNEDYDDLRSDVVRMVFAQLNGSLEEFLGTLENEVEPGTRWLYKSSDAQVLGQVLKGATGKTVTELTQEWLWNPLGMEGEAYWMVDGVGMEMCYGGLNVRARDYARFGLMFLNEGRNLDSVQVVPADWVADSYLTDEAHITPRYGSNFDNMKWGYGYQWWVAPEEEGEPDPVDFMAVGIFGQFVYINRDKDVVIVKNSAYQDYYNTGLAAKREAAYVMREIAESL